MSIPKQVEEAADLAEKYLESLNADPETKEQEDAEETEEETDEASNDADTEEDPDEEEAEEQETDVSKLLAEIEKKDQQYKSLQGKYNAEVPRLQTELKEMKNEIFARIGEIAESKAAPSEKEEQTSEMLDKFKEEYGDQYYSMLQEIIKQEVSPLLKETIKPVEDKVEKVSDSQAESAKNDFAKALDDNVTGDWRNALEGNDEGFLAFLEESDPTGLHTNAELFDLFNSKWQPEKMAKLMNMYFGENAPETEKPKTKKPSPDEEALVAPSRKTKHKTPSTTEAKIWTAQSIEEFKLADRQGKYSVDESSEIWNDLLLALSENRIH